MLRFAELLIVRFVVKGKLDTQLTIEDVVWSNSIKQVMLLTQAGPYAATQRNMLPREGGLPIAMACWYGDLELWNREVNFMKIEIQYCGQ